MENWTLWNAISCIPGIERIYFYVDFVELLSESHYSWFPSRRAKIHGSQVFKTKIHDSYMFCKYDSWCMIPLNPRHQGLSSSGPLSEVGLSLREVSSTLILSDENIANK